MSVFLSSPSRFYSGIPLRSLFPLARFLPPYYRETVTAYFKDIASKSEQGSRLILDPFGASPFLPIELANAGAAVIVCCNNPILRIFLRAIALSPTLEEFQTTLAEISALKKFDTRLETFFRSLYFSVCNTCFSEIEVDAYIWERGSSNSLYRLAYKQYQCSQCGSAGLFSVTIQDQQREQRLPPRTLIETQAASKVVKNSDPSYRSVIESLGIYPTRSLYAIVTLLNKLAELDFDQRQHQILNALLIGALDFTNALWGYPSKRHRPKQLSIPNQFIEMNFWQSLEKSLEWWVNSLAEYPCAPVFVSDYPQLPRPGEISIFSGRLRDLLPRISNQKFLAIVTALPRPNQAFWTLCAIWSGWLEGIEGARPLKATLSRKRYDWGWHCRALATTYKELIFHMPANIPCFGLIEEYEANFLAAALFAADQANLQLERLALRSEQGRAQIQWRTQIVADKKETALANDRNPPFTKLKTHIAKVIENSIDQSLEPAYYPQIHAVALANVVRSLDQKGESSPSKNYLLEIFPFQSIPDYPNFFLNLFEEAVQLSPALIPLGGEEKSLETRLWWISNSNLDHAPTSDQVEKAVFDFLLNHTSATFLEIDQEICHGLGQISVPPVTLILECLESYADYDLATNKWTLRKEEHPIQRSVDLDEIREDLITLGNRLGYLVEGDHPLLWVDKNHTTIALWYIQKNAAINPLLHAFYSHHTPTYLALPGSRVNLILYKLQRYPFLVQFLEKQLYIVRFRQIRWMVSQIQIDRSLFNNWLTIDPIRYQSSQLSLW